MSNELKFLLSKRELEVFKLITQGLSTKGISESLELRPNTISTIKKNINYKLGTRSDLDVFKLALKNKLVKLQ